MFKSRSHLKFTVTLSFYVLFLDLIFRNYLLPRKLNHKYSGGNTTKYLHLEEYILSTSNLKFKQDRPF